ncbi:Ig-like domain-containing protein, partial [Methanolobus sp.]|uniref:Ig-like domain-containing protein n=1 Tax=Methanolobus sp. TaxID=1874737 RepID=UPI0025FBBA08
TITHGTSGENVTQAITVNELAPAATTLAPIDGATDVALDATVSILFDRNVTANDLSGVTITGATQGAVGNVTATLAEDNRTVNIVHDAFANNNEVYTVTIPANAVNNSESLGNAEITWSFTAVALSSNANLTSVLSQTDGSPAGGDGSTSESAITWNISVARGELDVSYIAVASDATVHLYSNASFDANEDVAITLAVGETTGYINVTAQDGITIKYYAVTMARAASNVTTIAVADGMDVVVTDVNNTVGSEAVTVAAATTVADLIGAIESTDRTNQTYSVTDSVDGGKGDTDYLVTGDRLHVYSEDGFEQAAYTVTKEASTSTMIVDTSSGTTVTDVNNAEGSEAVTVVSGTTVATLTTSIGASDGSTQAYAVTDSSDGVKSEGALVTGDKLVVTAEDTVTSKTYTITVSA